MIRTKVNLAAERLEDAAMELLRRAENFATPNDWQRKELFKLARKYASAVQALSRARRR